MSAASSVVVLNSVEKTSFDATSTIRVRVIVCDSSADNLAWYEAKNDMPIEERLNAMRTEMIHVLEGDSFQKHSTFLWCFYSICTNR